MALTKPELSTQIQTTTAKFDDPLIVINAALTGANTDDLGILMNRGTTGDNVGIVWDRTAGAFALIETTADGDTAGDITFSAFADLQVKTLTTENFNLPAADGTVGQVLTTDGNGVVTWEDGGGGAGEWTVSGTDLLQVTAALTDVYFSDAITDATPLAQTIHAQGGTGTDITGAAITVAGGIGTGTGVGGDIIFQNALAGTTSSTPNTLTQSMIIDERGNVGIGENATPATNWSTFSEILQIGGNANIACASDISNFNWLDMRQNAIYDGTNNRYISDGAASIFELYNGGFWFGYVAAGTAGDTLSWSTALNITSSAAISGDVFGTVTAGSSSKIATAGEIKSYVDNAVPTTIWQVSGSFVDMAVSQLYTVFGEGNQSATPQWHSISAQNALGTDIAAADFRIGGGRGTGTGLGGEILLQIAPAGSTGSIQNNHATALAITSNADVVIEGGALILKDSVAIADTFAYGQIWLQSGSPNTLWFTDQAGTDFQVSGVGSGSWVASGTDLLQVTAGITDVYMTDAITDATPLAQTLHGQGGTGTNIAGATLTIAGGIGTGTGVGGSLIFQVATAGASSSTPNTLATALSIDSLENVAIGNAALGTTATDGFLYVPTCAGVPTGTPTTKTGRVALIFDTTNNDLYVYDGSWISVALA